MTDLGLKNRVFVDLSLATENFPRAAKFEKGNSD